MTFSPVFTCFPWLLNNVLSSEDFFHTHLQDWEVSNLRNTAAIFEFSKKKFRIFLKAWKKSQFSWICYCNFWIFPDFSKFFWKLQKVATFLGFGEISPLAFFVATDGWKVATLAKIRHFWRHCWLFYLFWTSRKWLRF